jgi:hypothetical protein
MVQIQQGVGGVPVDFQILTFQADNNAPENQVFPIDLSASITFQANVGTAFPLLYFLRLDTNHETEFDFLSTAQLRFDLPPGVSISSTGGFALAAVPEPAGLVLLGTGAVALLGYGAWRRSRPRA